MDQKKNVISSQHTSSIEATVASTSQDFLSIKKGADCIGRAWTLRGRWMWVAVGVVLVISLSAVLLAMCSRGGDKPVAHGDTLVVDSAACYDLDSIVAAGELRVVLLDAPDSYTEYDDTIVGLQYALADAFAQSIGVRLTVSVEADTAALVAALERGDADIVTFLLPRQVADTKRQLRTAGAHRYEPDGHWLVRRSASKLAEALDEWYSDALRDSIEERMFSFLADRYTVHMRSQRPYISLEAGIFSIYDDHFKREAKEIGIDWRLVAALCYEESGFDPNAVSRAGARGLMQVMPSVAEARGVEDYLEPRENIALGVAYLGEMLKEFSDIKARADRLKFAIAAYNVGGGHVRDAMALARKAGRDNQLWDEVAYYLARLHRSEFYQDAVVKHGFVVPRETVEHVVKVISRWKQYAGDIGMDVPRIDYSDGVKADSITVNKGRGLSVATEAEILPHQEKRPAAKTGRFTRNTEIYKPGDTRLRLPEEDTNANE